ncbi:MAG: DUF2304 domain-containing protein [Candidatus Eisenbacteria bacterium]|nr:DUF2304 domain-containing protein [Candidatus Eisenbacteria bacterium]
MHFLSRTQIITAFGAVALVFYVLDLVRRRKLSEDYSLLWMIASLVVAVLGFSTPLLTWITRALGIMGESSTVFAFGLGFATVMLLYLSIRLSRLGQENHALTRELALLRHEVDLLRTAAAPGPPGTAGGERA